MPSRHWKLIAIGIALCGAFAVSARTLLAKDDIAAQTQRVFEAAFATKVTEQISNPILRVRQGSETFCIQENHATRTWASTLIADLSDAFELGWRQILVDDLAACPEDITTFYVLQGARPDQAALLDLMEGIVGSRPPDPAAIFPEWARGMSVSLPGPGHREFVFASSYSDMPHGVARSILSEEFLQSILRASDVDATQIVSLLAEDLRNKDYSAWFENNPMGFCSVDIVLLELLLGPSTANLRKMDQMRAYLTTSFDALLEAAESRAKSLSLYRDPRCWVWETS